jgi:hypothetical protein
MCLLLHVAYLRTLVNSRGAILRPLTSGINLTDLIPCISIPGRVRWILNDKRESTCCGDVGGLWGVRGGLWSGLRRYGGRSGYRRRGRGDLTHQRLLEEELGLTITKARAEVTFGAIALVLQSGRWCGG